MSKRGNEFLSEQPTKQPRLQSQPQPRCILNKYHVPTDVQIHIIQHINTKYDDKWKKTFVGEINYWMGNVNPDKINGDVKQQYQQLDKIRLNKINLILEYVYIMIHTVYTKVEKVISMMNVNNNTEDIENFQNLEKSLMTINDKNICKINKYLIKKMYNQYNYKYYFDLICNIHIITMALNENATDVDNKFMELKNILNEITKLDKNSTEKSLGGSKKKQKVPKKYIPQHLTKKDKRKQTQMLKKSREMYKKKEYIDRKPVKSFKSKVSPHVKKAKEIYNVKNVSPNKELAKASGCSVKALKEIVKKGQGAYYSSGSRPNQTAHSWGIARLASAITSGKSAVVDYHILEKGCDHKKKAVKLAKEAQSKKIRKPNKILI